MDKSYSLICISQSRWKISMLCEKIKAVSYCQLNSSISCKYFVENGTLQPNIKQQNFIEILRTVIFIVVDRCWNEPMILLWIWLVESKFFMLNSQGRWFYFDITRYFSYLIKLLHVQMDQIMTVRKWLYLGSRWLGQWPYITKFTQSMQFNC